ncbi:uncharacterized protein LOC129728516 [Wyeomyia smithii]|uniref:uncharacterized protein LOC129728516 n=1 Tax=Wyeomyia smithii TaxID=174621 RepID=UPI0024681596|nr:uncharacterized protein LOC129728516 [Wyeomyia smithii]
MNPKPAEKGEIIVDDILSDPEYIAAHGFNVEYLMIMEDMALNDVFSVAKWTGHKYALRRKLMLWEDGILFQNNASASEPVAGTSPETSADLPTAHTSTQMDKTKLISKTVTSAVLDSILERNEKGKIVCNYYRDHHFLDKVHRNFLAHTIVDYYIANQTYFKPADMAQFSELIAERFKPEIAITYYNPRDISAGKDHTSGALYDRFHNRRHLNRPLVPCTKRKQSKVKIASFLSEQQTAASQLQEEDITKLDAIKAWLRNNFDKSDNFSKQWKDSILLRLRSILQDTNINKSTVLLEWPRYLDENGYLLIDSDFNFLYQKSDDQCNLFNKWEWFCTNFYEYILSSALKDQYSIHLLSVLENGNCSQDSRDFILCAVFHAIIKPVRTSATKLPTILQAQLDTCLVCNTQEVLSNSLQVQREEFEKADIQFAPRIYAVGSTERLECFYVVTHNLQYKLPSFVRCLDVVVKLKYTLDLNFSESAELFWAFLSRYFYGVEYNNKSKNTQVLQLLDYLQKREV